MKIQSMISLFVLFSCLFFGSSEISALAHRGIFLTPDARHLSPAVTGPAISDSLTRSSRTVNRLTGYGIKESIPDRYRAKFQRWKTEFLSTDFGRRQWDYYAGNKNFLLTINIADDRKQGAKTDDYLWDENGNFVGATITLGSKPEKGFPDPVYYPVMNSLASGRSVYSVEGDILAATKLAHEIGHVNQTFKETKESFELRNSLTPVYISIFLKNGHNAQDLKLVELADRMGGTPMKIWESREYWSEVNAMFFLKEKISREIFFCNVFGKIKTNVETYAKNYERRFNGMKISVCEK